MNNKSVKMICEAGLYTAIYAAFMYIFRAGGGMLESLFFFILPFPMILFYSRYNLKNSITLFIAMMIVTFLISPLSSLFYVFPAGILGIIYGYLKKNNKNEVIQIFTAILCCFIVNTLTMYVFASVFKYNIYEDFGPTINSILSLIDSIFKTNLASVKLDFYITLLVPSLLLITSLLEGYLMHMICSIILDKFKLVKRKNLPFFLVQLPIWLGLMSLLCVIFGVFTLIFIRKDNLLIFEVGKFVIALGLLGYVLLFIQGLARITCIVLHNGKAKIYPLVLVLSILLNILVIFFGFIAIFNDNRDELLYNVRWKE